MDYFFYILENFKLTDLLDILIIAFLIYRFLIIIRGTRAVKLIFGVIFFMILYWLSINYELSALNWILSNFFEYFFLFLIVIFQDPIKTALTDIGFLKLFRRNKKIIMEEDIEELTTALEDLSKLRLGALIVIEREDGLYNFSRTGTKMNSRISSALVYSIFQNSSPLHDGAIIIYDNQIQAAGCFLPLSKNNKVDRHLGTRHRAALGLSEVSDAVTICLSEEKSSVTIAFKGELLSVNDFTDLSVKLYKILYSQQNVKGLGYLSRN